jgi:hypothetical protein
MTNLCYYEIYNFFNVLLIFSVCRGCFCFVSVKSKHLYSVVRYRSETTETKILFRIVSKLVSFPVSVVSNRNYSSFVGHPTSGTL